MQSELRIGSTLPDVRLEKTHPTWNHLCRLNQATVNSVGFNSNVSALGYVNMCEFSSSCTLFVGDVILFNLLCVDSGSQ